MTELEIAYLKFKEAMEEAKKEVVSCLSELNILRGAEPCKK